MNDAACTELYTLSLHDALPIYASDGHLRIAVEPSGHWIDAVVEVPSGERVILGEDEPDPRIAAALVGDRKSTRLNSSHSSISYAVFCLKKKTLTFLCPVPFWHA